MLQRHRLIAVSKPTVPCVRASLLLGSCMTHIFIIKMKNDMSFLPTQPSSFVHSFYHFYLFDKSFALYILAIICSISQQHHYSHYQLLFLQSLQKKEKINNFTQTCIFLHQHTSYESFSPHC